MKFVRIAAKGGYAVVDLADVGALIRTESGVVMIILVGGFNMQTEEIDAREFKMLDELWRAEKARQAGVSLEENKDAVIGNRLRGKTDDAS